MVVGDIGYGLVFAGLAWYLYSLVRRNQPLRMEFFKIRLAPDRVAQMVHILTPMIVWTVLWGLVYGEMLRQPVPAAGYLRNGVPSGIDPHPDPPDRNGRHGVPC